MSRKALVKALSKAKDSSKVNLAKILTDRNGLPGTKPGPIDGQMARLRLKQ